MRDGLSHELESRIPSYVEEVWKALGLLRG